jgi:hypothetical protein
MSRHRQPGGLRPFRANTGSRSSLNHFIDSSEKAGRDDNARRLGGLKIDNELKLGRQRDGHIDRLFTLEDAASVNAYLAISILLMSTGGGDSRGRRRLMRSYGRELREKCSSPCNSKNEIMSATKSVGFRQHIRIPHMNRARL